MIYTIIGFFAGVIGGMGMGGGTILIPALIMFVNIDPKIAQSINLLSSIPIVNDNITMNRKWKIKMYKNDH